MQKLWYYVIVNFHEIRDLFFRTYDGNTRNEVVRFTSDGKVGIGTGSGANIAERLTISGGNISCGGLISGSTILAGNGYTGIISGATIATHSIVVSGGIIIGFL